MSTNFKPTAEQEAICEAARGTQKNLLVRADAGVGKTTTLKLLAGRMAPRPALAIAFNKKIATDLEGALPTWFTVKTLNGLGHGALAKAAYLQGRRLELINGKLGKITSEVFKEAGFEGTEEDWSEVRDWANAARQAGMIHSEFTNRFRGLVEDEASVWDDLSTSTAPSADLRGMAREVLRRATLWTFQGRIDFDDQIYASTLLGGVYPQFGLVLVDEAQDLSPLNHLQIRKLGAQARLIVVGDPKQAIYAFRGADSQSFQKIHALRPADSWLELPLHMTFRCPKIVVARQQGHAPGYAAASSNPEGQFAGWFKEKGKLDLSAVTPEEMKAFAARVPAIRWNGVDHEGWSASWLMGLKESSGDRIAVLCRNNAPLLSLAFKLIRQGIGPEMLGRDIGAGLVKLAKSITKGKEELDAKGTLELINRWQRDEEAKAELMERTHLIAGIVDRAECLKAVLEQPGVDSPKALMRAIENLFAREYGEIVLATGHKAKGLEFHIVLHLDPWRIPSRFASKDPTQMGQEMNLKYVIETRTMRTLIEANLEDFV